MTNAFVGLGSVTWSVSRDMAVLRHLIKFLLLGLFLYAVGNAIYNWYMKYTNTVVGYQDIPLPFPSLTICPDQEPYVPYAFAPKQNQTLVEFFEYVEPFSFKITSATVFIGNDYKDEYLADMFSEPEAITDFVIPLKYSSDPPFRLIFCTSIQIPKERETFDASTTMAVGITF